MSEVRRFACRACGKCCNRSPEVELSEAAALADLFVFRLMFRLYSLPRLPQRGAPGGAELFFQKKRLLAHHAARKYSRKVMCGGRVAEYTFYLMVSALAMDTRPGSCDSNGTVAASIISARSVAAACRFTIRQIEWSYAVRQASFVGTPGFPKCDTEEMRPALAGVRIVDPEMLQVRAEAAALAGQDRSWKEAIARKMKPGRPDPGGLPSLDKVEANAHLAAMTSSMRIAWDIAAETGPMTDEQRRALGRLQLAAVKTQASRLASAAPTEAPALLEMRADYRRVGP